MVEITEQSTHFLRIKSFEKSYINSINTAEMSENDLLPL